MSIKERIVENIKNSNDKNKSVKELIQGQRVLFLYFVLTFAVYYISALYSLCLLFEVNMLYGIAMIGVFGGILTLLFAVLLVQQSLYIFLRKQFCMIEKEDYEGIVGDNDSDAAE